MSHGAPPGVPSVADSVADGVADEDRIELDKAANRAVRRRSFRLLGSLLRPMRARVARLVAVVVAAQAARASGPLLIAVGVDEALPRLRAGDARSALWYGAALVAVGLAGGALSWLSIRLTAAVSQAALLDLRRRVFRHCQRLDLDFHGSYTSGRAIARQTSDVDDIRELLDTGAGQLLSGLMFMLLNALLLLLLDPPSAAVLVLALVPVFGVTRWFHRASQRQYRTSRTASANLIGHFVETMVGMRAVQAFRRERGAATEYAGLSEAFRDADMRTISLNGVYDPALVLIGNLTVAALLAIDGYRMLSGELAIGTLIAAVLYAKRSFQPLEQMARFYNALQAAVASLEKISGLLARRPAVGERPVPVALPTARGEIAFEGVVFRYRPGVDTVPGLDLRVPAGQTVALVGGSGAGKSTIARLLARFYDVAAGRVRLDGIDVRDLSFADLRRHVLLVTQESYLFSGSVADNIALGKPGATRDEIVAAARAVGCDGFVRALPDGYDTEVNARGARLSAGQRQLVCFARAFLADPTVVVLDEATSSLDLAGEAAVQHALVRLLEGRTALIIAHRLSTVEMADRVVVLRDGRIVEDGSPATLRERGGDFARMSHHPRGRNQSIPI
ncbi:ABC transporter ATP-binding protein [Acrocarpospora catenulata]|uniref:ABC transporter ATP-binding protein n=1 Tax=Acrocarpospora catenulata TaxID=2836182 RepID=UPI001BD9CF03|nr:ABC transporter ATP-binding protein [Acrocarpospora catenulata]